MEANSTRKMIDYPWTRRKERMKGIKTVPNTIKVFINVFDEALEISLLFCGEFSSTDSVRGLVFSML